MNVISVCLISIFAVICGVVLRKYSPETAALMLTATVVLTALAVIPYINEIISSVRGFAESAAVQEKYISALVKSVGICCITQITADICRENGGQSAATQVELCGRVAILLIALPLYSDLLGKLNATLFL